MDFSEFETARSGIWRICAVIDYATRYCLAATLTPTSRGQDALGCLRRPLSRPNGSAWLIPWSVLALLAVVVTSTDAPAAATAA